tara:strand:+ start:56 stop:409 length:354 start_codon:yes stop_codon:yes gene_type:complete
MAIHYISPDLTFKSSKQSKSKFTSFQKTELNLILSVYAQKVSQGHWKDYAIDHGQYTAVFSIYRSTFENAFLRIIKNKKKGGHSTFTLLDFNNNKIKQSYDLSEITKYLKVSIKRIA